MGETNNEAATPKRPDRHSREVLEEAAKKLLPMVLGWLGEAGDQADEDAACEVLNNLAEAMEDAVLGFDGYRLAKYLEDHRYYDVDSQLVEILDGAEAIQWKAWMERVRQWVTQHNIKPTFSVGARVRFRSGWSDHRGVIARICEAEAVYVVQEEGKSYPPSTSDFVCGTLVAYEDCELMEENQRGN